MVAAASAVTATFVRKLYAAFACKGSDYGGGGGGGVVVARQDSCSAATALSIGVPVFPVDGPSGSIAIDLISRARGDGGGGGSGGSGGSGGGRGSSLASGAVYVVMGAIGNVFPTKKLIMGASFSNRCHPLPPQNAPWTLVFADSNE